MRFSVVVFAFFLGLVVKGEDVVRFDAGRLLMERFPSKELVAEDNFKALEEGIVPGYAVTNVVLWLERMGRDMSAYKSAHKIAYPVAKPLPKDFKVGYMLDLDRGRIPTMEMFKIIVDVLDLKLRVEAARDAKKPIPANAADEYRRLWRPFNREGGLEYSLGQRRYR